MKCVVQNSREFSRKLDLRGESSRPVRNSQNAGVLILLHDDGSESPKVLLCVRAQNMRRHPGEVCFPGGMMDTNDEEDLRKTAVRETFEEVGLQNGIDYSILGNLPEFRARFGVVIHPTVAILKRPPEFSLNSDEVQSVFWQPLDTFLENEHHSTFAIDSFYNVHVFQFPSSPTTYGVTALMCIVVAIAIVGKLPKFDLLANLTVQDVKNRKLSTHDVISHVFEFAGRIDKSKI